MTKAPNITETEAYRRHQRALSKYQDAYERRRLARREVRSPTPTAADDPEAREAAYNALLQAKAAARIGVGTSEAVSQAEARLAELDQPRATARERAREELRLVDLEVAMLEEQLAKARAALAHEAADHMRPSVTKWLDTLAAFLQANEAMHAAEITLSTAGIKPPVTAARDLVLVTGEHSRSHLAWLLAGVAWSTHFTAELAEYKNLTSTPLLARDRTAQAARERHLQERTEAARQKADAVTTTPARNPNPRHFGIVRRNKAPA